MPVLEHGAKIFAQAMLKLVPIPKNCTQARGKSERGLRDMTLYFALLQYLV